MVFTTITAIGGFVAFFFYHRLIVGRLERGLYALEAHLDYNDEVLDMLRQHTSEMLGQMEASLVRKAKRTPKNNKKLGRPVNPNSVRQKKLKGIK
jgi:hypothetical protein